MNPGQTEETSEIVSQEQPERESKSQEQPEQKERQAVPKEGNDTPATPRKKRRVKREQTPTEAELMPRPSYWPLALAVAISILLLGAVSNLIVLSIGAVLVTVAIMGWTLERR